MLTVTSTVTVDTNNYFLLRVSTVDPCIPPGAENTLQIKRDFLISFPHLQVGFSHKWRTTRILPNSHYIRIFLTVQGSSKQSKKRPTKFTLRLGGARLLFKI